MVLVIGWEITTLCARDVSITFYCDKEYVIFKMSTSYAKRFEAVFLCTHKRPKSDAKYMHKSEDFIRK